MPKRIVRATVFCCLGVLFSVNGTSPAEDGAASIVAPTETAECSGEGILKGLTKLLRSFSPARQASAQQLESRPEVGPSHVQTTVLDLIAEIELLREAEEVTDYPPEAELQEDRLPVHAYFKSLEVMKKLSRLQGRLGLPPGQPKARSVGSAKDLFDSVGQIVGELRKVKTHLAVSGEIQPGQPEDGATFSTVYKTLGDASFLLDGLVGYPISPSDVFANVLEIQDELELIAAKLKANLALDPPEVDGKKSAKEAAQQVLRATYKVIGLQMRLGMDASSLPTLTLVRVTPSQVYEATSIILAEVTRIKTHLDISLPRLPRPEPRNKRLEEVFVQMLLLIENLDVLTEAATRMQNGSIQAPESTQ